MGTIPPTCVVQMSDRAQASQFRPLGRALSGEAYWQDRENSCAQVLVAQMWDKHTLLFVYTWLLCMYCACLLAFWVHVVVWWSPMTKTALHGHHFQILVSASWRSSWGATGHATVSILKRQIYFRPLIEVDCTWCLGLKLFQWDLKLCFRKGC